MRTKNKLAFIIMIGTLCFGLLAQAQPPGGSERGRRGPPPEAFEACSGASEGETCTVDTPHGTLDGTCQQLPDSEGLACVPNDHRGGPPPRGDR